MNLYLSKNMNKEQAVNYVNDKSNYKNFKEFLIRDYFSYKIILFIAFSLLLHNLHLALLSLHELFY